nr:LysR family transcriptional regulator [Raoultella sp. NCTC 9187]
MLNLQRMAMFVAVVDCGSFTAAAVALAQTKAVVSFNVRQLESELGVTLLLRSTRRLTLTDAGTVFYQRGVGLLKAAENLQDEVRASHAGLSGELRITTTPEYGTRAIVPALAEFSQLHPALRVRHVSSSHHADLISERFDVAIRLGTLADSRYRAALISRFAILPLPHPRGWRSIRWQPLKSWPRPSGLFTSACKPRCAGSSAVGIARLSALKLKKTPRLSADSANALMAFALAGSGVALLPQWLVASSLAQGHLVHLLPELSFPPQGVYAVYPDARHVPTRVRAFIDFLRQRVG